MLEAAGLGRVMAKHFELDEAVHAPDLGPWTQLVERTKHPKAKVPVALVGKYVSLPDAYLGVIESLNHAGIHPNLHTVTRWRSPERLDAPAPSPRMCCAGTLLQ